MDVSLHRGRKRCYTEYVEQSGAARFNVSVNTPERTTEEQIVTFSDQNPAFSYDVGSDPDPSFALVSTNDDSLENFFNRPLKIAEFEWQINNVLFETFNPWQLFFANPRVINRITNFNLMRCKMNVKIVLNGNGFYFGSAIASYLPLHLQDQFTINRGLFPEDIIACSQRPHIYLNPTASQGGHMTLPFVWNKNALNIPTQEWIQMGEMNIRHINLLQHANGASESVTISVFAWVTDMSLDIPTSTDPGGIVPQSGKAKAMSADEYGTGPVSKPASIIAKAAGALTMAPVIGTYAKATSIAATAIASIARAFGYSRPAVIEDVCPYKPTYMGNIANTNAGDTCQRLTLDAKQEVTIDPRTVGLGNVDEMALVPLAMRESYLTTFQWATTSPPEAKLWNSYVCPALWGEVTAGELPEIHMTPACWVTMPFKYWRGSMKFRFQVVASNYHKGRLKVVYDPYYQTTNEYNTNYTYILDIAEEKDFTVTVGWGQEASYALPFTPGVDPLPYGTGVLPGPQAEANGMLSIYIVNDLTTPSDLPEVVSVNVFVSMCEDFEVGNPTDEHIEQYVFANEPSAAAAALRTEALKDPLGPKEWPLGKVDLQRRIDELKIKKQKRQNKKASERIAEFVESMEMANFIDPELLEEQSGQESGLADVDNTDNYAAPMTMESDVTLGNAEMSPTDRTTDVYLGEAVTSLRQMLKRYLLHTTFGPSIFGSIVYKRNQNDMPYYRGAVPGAIHAATINGQFTPYNRCKVTLLNWFVPAFVAWRGALRWKYQLSANIEPAGGGGSLKNVLKDSHYEVTRWATEPYGYQESHVTFAENGTDASVFVATNLPTKVNSLNGVTRSQLSQNPVVEVELPWYSNRRFFYGKKADLTTNGTDDHYHEFQSTIDLSAAEQESMMFDDFCSIGEDFSLFFFTGFPIVYFRGPDDPPV